MTRPVLALPTLLLLASVLLIGCSSLSLSPGDEARIIVTEPGRIPVAIDESAYAEMAKVANVGDGYGIGELADAGKIFLVESNTRVLIIDQSDGSGLLRIRILEGPVTGKAGWVQSNLLTQ